MPRKIMIIVSIFLFAPFIINTGYSYGNATCSCTGNTNNQLDMVNNAISNYSPIILAIIGSGGLVGIFVTQHLTERYKIREQYFKPYVEWSLQFSGTLHEFEEICRNIMLTSNGCTPKNSPTDIISHLCQMHDQLEEGYQHVSWIKKNNWADIEPLDDFMDIVDRLWHWLESNYPDVFITSKNNPDMRLKQILFRCHRIGNTDSIVKDIRDSIDRDTRTVFKEHSKNLENKVFKIYYDEWEKDSINKEKLDQVFFHYFDPIYYILAAKAPNVGLTTLDGILGRLTLKAKIFFGQKITYRYSIQD